MIGYTPVEEDLRARRAAESAAPATGRAARYADAHKLLNLAERTPGLPFPRITEDCATFHFILDDAARARVGLRLAELNLTILLRTDFTPRRVAGPDGAYHVLGAVLPSGMRVDLTALAVHIDGKDGRAPELGATA